MSAPGADPAARLISTRIDVLVAEMAEPGRLRRGRQYAKQGAVGGLQVQTGVVSASIQGSRAQPYVASAKVTLATAGDGGLGALVPGRRDVRFSCTCPDDDAPCKHAVALMAQFSERLAYDPSLFLRWRTGGAELGAGDPGGDTADTGGNVRAIRTVDAVPRFGDDDRERLAAFLGEPMEALPMVSTLAPTLPTLAGPRGAWDDVWAEMLTSALDALQRPAPPLRRH